MRRQPFLPPSAATNCLTTLREPIAMFGRPNALQDQLTMPSSERRRDAGVAPTADVALERAFAFVEPSRPESTSELRDAVCAYVDAERARAEPAERIIVSIKAIAERARVTASQSRRASPLSMSDRDELLTRAVTWCIERYYQTGQPKQ